MTKDTEELAKIDSIECKILYKLNDIDSMAFTILCVHVVCVFDFSLSSKSSFQVNTNRKYSTIYINIIFA